MATIAFIVANAGNLNADYETPFKDRMENELGLTVTLITDNDAEATDFSIYDAIVSSMQCTEANIDGLAATATPHLFMEQSVTDEYGFGNEGTGTGNETQIDIDDNTHYITNPYSTGDITVQASDNQKYFTGWANDVNPICLREGEATQCIIAVIDDGETLADSSSAAERRVWFGLYQGDDLDATGWNIFDRSVGWCLYEDAAGDSGSADLSANVTIQNKGQQDLSVNVTIQNKSQADLSANFTIQKSAQADLSANVTIQNKGQADLSANLQIPAQTGSADLSANVTIQNKSQVDLSANVTIQNVGQYDLSANTTIQNKSQYDLSSNVTIQNKGQYDLSTNVTIQNKGQQDLSASVTIQNKGQYDLSANVTIQKQAQADLSANFTIVSAIQFGQYDLSANFTIGTDHGYITLADALVHNIPISSQTHTIELSNSIHNIVVTAATHDIELSDQIHQIVVSSEPLK